MLPPPAPIEIFGKEFKFEQLGYTFMCRIEVADLIFRASYVDDYFFSEGRSDLYMKSPDEFKEYIENKIAKISFATSKFDQQKLQQAKDKLIIKEIIE